MFNFKQSCTSFCPLDLFSKRVSRWYRKPRTLCAMMKCFSFWYMKLLGLEFNIRLSWTLNHKNQLQCACPQSKSICQLKLHYLLEQARDFGVCMKNGERLEAAKGKTEITLWTLIDPLNETCQIIRIKIIECYAPMKRLTITFNETISESGRSTGENTESCFNMLLSSQCLLFVLCLHLLLQSHWI